MMAWRARWWPVTSSDLVMEHLLEDRREVPQEVALDLWGPGPPDVLGSGGHDSTSHGSASEINPVSACEISLVARAGRGRERRLAGSGIRSR